MKKLPESLIPVKEALIKAIQNSFPNCYPTEHHKTLRDVTEFNWKYGMFCELYFHDTELELVVAGYKAYHLAYADPKEFTVENIIHLIRTHMRREQRIWRQAYKTSKA
jgi:hypothetical protein